MKKYLIIWLFILPNLNAASQVYHSGLRDFSKNGDTYESPHISVTYENNSSPTFHILFDFFDNHIIPEPDSNILLTFDGVLIGFGNTQPNNIDLHIQGEHTQDYNYILTIYRENFCNSIRGGFYYHAILTATRRRTSGIEKSGTLVIISDEAPIDLPCDKLCTETICQGQIPYADITNITNYLFELFLIGEVTCEVIPYIYDSSTDADWCPEVIIGVSGNKSNIELDFPFYPNPASDKLLFRKKSDMNEFQVKIFVYGGTLVLSKFIRNEEFNEGLDISHIPGGCYLVSISTYEKTINEKLIISR